MTNPTSPVSPGSPGTPDDIAHLSGLEVLGRHAELQQARPTIGALLGMRLTRVIDGEVTFELATRPDFSNPLGTVHGGIAATLLDSAMGCAVHSTLSAGDWYTTLELKTNYIRAVPLEGQVLTAHGTTIHVGRTTATAEGRIHDQDGRLIAHGTTTCVIKRNPSTVSARR